MESRDRIPIEVTNSSLTYWIFWWVNCLMDDFVDCSTLSVLNIDKISLNMP
jgi:hypothetical protein